MAESDQQRREALSRIVADAMPAIKNAVARGFISPRDIAKMLPPRLTKRPQQLRSTVGSLAFVLGALGVVVVFDRPDRAAPAASKRRRSEVSTRRKQQVAPRRGAIDRPSPVITADDETLLQEVRRRPDAFTAIDTRWRRPFHRCVAGVLHDWVEAEDVVQEAFLKMYRYADTFESRGGEQKFSSWAYRIVLNTAYTRYRKLKEWRRFAVWPQEDEDGRPLADENSPGLAAKSRELWVEAEEQTDSKITVDRLLSQLPEDMRSLLTAYYLDGLAYEEISGKMGISNGTIKMRLFRARRHCQRLLSGDNAEAVGEDALGEMLEEEVAPKTAPHPAPCLSKPCERARNLERFTTGSR